MTLLAPSRAQPSKRLGRRPVDSTGSTHALPASVFHVCVHDVSPVWRSELEILLDALEERLNTYALAVTPRWHNLATEKSAWSFLRQRGSEILAHGLTHRRGRTLSPVSLVNRFADEWNGMPAEQLDAELHTARTEIEHALGRIPIGVVAPCWQWGAFDRESLHGFSFAVGYRALWSPDQRRPLTTRSWDWGPMSPANPLLSRWSTWLPREASFSIVLHPVDVRRGKLRAGLAAIDRLLERGVRPATFGEVLG